MTEKICKACTNSFPATTEYFCKRSENKDGLYGKCRNCLKERERVLGKQNWSIRRIQQDVRVQEKRKNNICLHCKNKRLPNSKNYCEKHLLMAKSNEHFNDSKYWKDLKTKLENQNYECYYSGVKLILGVNTSLDHKIPRSSNKPEAFGIDNIVWADKFINIMKNKLTDKEFLETCKTIIEYTNKKEIIHKLSLIKN